MSYFEAPISVVVSAKVMTPNGVGYASVITPIAGSPFQCKEYRAASTTTGYVVDSGGVTTVDNYRRIKFMNASAQIAVDMQLTLPGGETLLVKRVRGYGWTLQVDCESGAL